MNPTGMNPTVTIDLTGTAQSAASQQYAGQPVNCQQASPQMQAEINQTQQAMAQAMQGFAQQDTQQQREQRATGFLHNLRQYIGSQQFQNDVNETAQKYNMPAKAVASNFFEKALGTVGDILGVAITVVRNGAHSVVNIAAGIAHGIIDLICNIAAGLGRMITFNKTCQPIAA